MNVTPLLKELDRQINQLTSAREAVASLGNGTNGTKHVGRRPLSAAARRRISLAQKARWRKQKAS